MSFCHLRRRVVMDLIRFSFILEAMKRSSRCNWVDRISCEGVEGPDSYAKGCET